MKGIEANKSKKVFFFLNYKKWKIGNSKKISNPNEEFQQLICIINNILLVWYFMKGIKANKVFFYFFSKDKNEN
jgi:hypothetical protein